MGRLLRVDSRVDAQGRVRTYSVVSQVFFASAEIFAGNFDYREVVPQVRIDVGHVHFCSITAISALDKVVLKFKRESTPVEVVGMSRPCPCAPGHRRGARSGQPWCNKIGASP